jgi:phage shock protein PspC (stress-responsive transcriptional regulator)
MNIIYIAIPAIFCLIIAIGIGLELSKNIDITVIYVIFWMLYCITLLTFMIIIGYIYFYFVMKDKEGPPGPKGLTGDRGMDGPVGQCDPSCRDTICINTITDNMKKTLLDLNNKQPIEINNVYLKGKIKQICSSDEFKTTLPYKGPQALITYLSDICNTWISLIYNAGGKSYFESIGGDMEWEWSKNNPYDEIKKYDVFYWGMGPEYRPQIMNQCNNNRSLK